jgi:hypothetical protein
MEMEYKTNLENLIAAAYLSGAAEALNKSKELTSEDLTKNLDDLKILRRTFLRRAEEEGYHQPVHHIEEAKKKAFELLTEKTKYPNAKPTNTSNAKPINASKPFSIFGMFDKKTPNVSNVKTPNVSNVKTPNVSNVKTPNVSNVKTPTFFNTNVSKAVNALANNTHLITTPPPTAAQYTPPVLSLGGKRKL